MTYVRSGILRSSHNLLQVRVWSIGILCAAWLLRTRATRPSHVASVCMCLSIYIYTHRGQGLQGLHAWLWYNCVSFLWTLEIHILTPLSPFSPVHTTVCWIGGRDNGNTQQHSLQHALQHILQHNACTRGLGIYMSLYIHMYMSEYRWIHVNMSM